ncbi:MAG: hypothetical protein IKY66_07515 [Bacteroidales bacterium]|nr:hypothetical protein [Bacteroidales bacterium]
MRATLSILGLYNYDNTIFDDLTLPEELDTTTAIDSILSECAELEIIYPDPDMIKQMIALWSARELPVWERIYKAVTAEYNPLENYNRKETWADTDIGSASGSSNATSTNKVVGYNDTAFTNHDQNTGTGSSNSSSRLESRHNGTVSGNIGVTTSQEMLEQELDVAPRTDIYSYIVRSFKNRFCLMVY